MRVCVCVCVRDNKIPTYVERIIYKGGGEGGSPPSLMETPPRRTLIVDMAEFNKFSASEEHHASHAHIILCIIPYISNSDVKSKCVQKGGGRGGVSPPSYYYEFPHSNV